MKTLDIKVNFEKLELPSYLVFGVYFHGTLQEHLGYDLVYSWTKLYLEHEIEGCHKCKTLDGKPAKLYLWYSRDRKSTRLNSSHRT